MFLGAKSFKKILCGNAWLLSLARKPRMFEGSSGSISQTGCTSTSTPGTMHVTRRHVFRRPNSEQDVFRRPNSEQDIFRRPNSEREDVFRRPITERELITSTLITTSSIAPTIANTMTCPKCGTFEKSGRVSCCAPGGAWYKNCGGAGNRNVDHKWFEGVEACGRTFKADHVFNDQN